MSETNWDGAVVKCPRCKGKGEEPTNPFFGVATLGMAWVVWSACPPDCQRCDGAGFIRAYAKR